jgi:hypothetical protein
MVNLRQLGLIAESEFADVVQTTKKHCASFSILHGA